tara:strand:- start:17478 stop:18884 length:1407 start_codon:yes stop_codon:yes gene_type:complete
MMNQKKIITTLILISFFVSIFFSFQYLNKYDDYSKYKQNKHPMIKIAVENHWGAANEIVNDFREGKSFLESGLKFPDEYLPGKILALYYLLTGEELYENGLIKKDNGKFLYLALKTLFYYFAVYFFFIRSSKILNSKTCFFSTVFLIFLPDLIQYHSSFWNESLFFSFQIIFLTLVISNNFSIMNNVLIGIFFSTMYLITQEFIFYFLILIFYYLYAKIKLKVKFIKSILSFFIGFSFLTSIQLYETNLKTGKDRLNINNIQSALYIYIVPSIISEKKNISVQDAKEFLRQQSIEWADLNNIKYEKNSNFILKIPSDNINDKVELSNYMLKKSIITILSHPIITSRLFLRSTAHLMVLNPFYIKYFYQYNGKGEFLKTQTHQNLIPVRIVYTIIIYVVIFFGFIKSRKSINDELNLLLILSILYVILIGGWLGIPRYFTPALIFMSIYFGIFFETKNFNLLKKDKTKI